MFSGIFYYFIIFKLSLIEYFLYVSVIVSLKQINQCFIPGLVKKRDLPL